jgi:hypothetical protein
MMAGTMFQLGSRGIRNLALICAIIAMSSCEKRATVQIPMPATEAIDPSQYSTDQYKRDLQDYKDSTKPASLNLVAAKVARNNIAYGLMTEIEVIYKVYYQKFFGGKNTTALVGDAITLGLGSAGTIATNAATKTIFAALGTAITGLNLSIDKNFYAQQSFSVIGIAMQTRRDKIRAAIQANLLNEDVTIYPLTAVKRDLMAYLNAGTLASGLQELQEEAGAATATDRTPKTTAVPAAPNNLTASAGPAQISLLWDPVAGASSYNVYSAASKGVSVATGTKIATTTTNSYSDKSPNPANPTFYVVTAVNSAGESPISNEVSATPSPTGGKSEAGYPPPTDLKVRASDSKNSLAWTAPAGAQSINIYRSQNSGVLPTDANKIGSTLDNSYQDSTAKNGVRYFYVVTAAYPGSNESSASNEVSATPAVQKVGGPAPVTTAH